MKLSTKGTDFGIDDFSDMPINPFDVPEGKYIFEAYAPLRRKRVFSTLPEGRARWTLEDLHKLLCFIVFYVDPECPLASESDMSYRTQQATRLCCLTKDDVVLEEIKQQGPLYREFMYEYFKLVNVFEFETWITLKIAFHNDAEILRTRMNPDELEASTINARRSLQTGLIERQQELAKLQQSLFPDPRVERIVVEAAQEEELGGWAEEFAEKNPFLPGAANE